jgi:hypothetical protein
MATRVGHCRRTGAWACHAALSAVLAATTQTLNTAPELGRLRGLQEVNASGINGTADGTDVDLPVSEEDDWLENNDTGFDLRLVAGCGLLVISFGSCAGKIWHMSRRPANMALQTLEIFNPMTAVNDAKTARLEKAAEKQAAEDIESGLVAPGGRPGKKKKSAAKRNMSYDNPMQDDSDSSDEDENSKSPHKLVQKGSGDAMHFSGDALSAVGHKTKAVGSAGKKLSGDIKTALVDDFLVPVLTKEGYREKRRKDREKERARNVARKEEKIRKKKDPYGLGASGISGKGRSVKNMSTASIGTMRSNAEDVMREAKNTTDMTRGEHLSKKDRLRGHQ